jgi:hypothetical protein
VGARVRGAAGHSRTELLVAAHHVIVLVSYLEILDEVGSDHRHELPVIEMVDRLSEAPLPFPAVHLGYEDLLSSLLRFYGSYLRLDDAQRAVDRFEELYRQLEEDCPEFALWAQREERRATDQMIRSGLAELSNTLDRLASDRPPARWPERLSRACRVLLDRPIAEAHTAGLAEQGLPDLVIPSLGEAYVEPPFRTASASSQARPSMDHWWNNQTKREDLVGFLAAYLCHPAAREAPLLVLGHPGAGKSVLTKQLAARLPAQDYLPVRVELRDVPSDAPLQDQIEHALKVATGEHMDWPTLVREAGDVVPVVLLDGFDELLQNSARSHWNYLTDVVRFQQREADQGRPAVVIVTSRTAVTAHAEIPAGAVMLRLEPFGSSEIASWVRTWNHANTGYFATRGLRPLDLDVVSGFPTLAEQPLLLLMLALYDAPANGLGQVSSPLGGVDLYERLITDFVRRQLRKLDAALSPAELDQAVELEIAKLSICALGMFHRGQQWLGHEDLADDLRALLPDESARRTRARLPESKLLFGRFFFVHKSRETVGPATLETYEFLHATFGEYLVARMVCMALVDLAVSAGGDSRALPFGQQRIDDALLRGLLSFAVLSDREQAVEFAQGLLRRTFREHSGRVREVLLELFARAMHEFGSGPYDGYRPRGVGVPARHATYSANLLLLTVLVGDRVSVSELFDERPVEQWRSHAWLWRSQLDPNSWSSFTGMLSVKRTDHGELHIELGEPAPIDLGWHFAPNLVFVGGGSGGFHRLTFFADEELDILVSIAEPLLAQGSMLVRQPGGRLVAASELFVDPPSQERVRQLPDAIEAALANLGLRTGTEPALLAIARRVRDVGIEWPSSTRARIARQVLAYRASLPEDLREALGEMATGGALDR